MELNKIIQGDCLEVLKTFPENSIDSIVTDPPYELGFMGKSTCILYGRYVIMGLWKHFGIKLKRQTLVGYGMAQTMALGMVKFVLKERSFTPIDYLMSGLRVKYLKVIKLTIYVESLLVATQTIWKRLLQRLMSIVATQQSHILLKLTV
jgi:tRNA G10  N-methylase Trm11